SGGRFAKSGDVCDARQRIARRASYQSGTGERHSRARQQLARARYSFLSRQRSEDRQYSARANQTRTEAGRRPLSDPITDDQLAARVVHHLLRGDRGKHFLGGDRKSLARSRARFASRARCGFDRSSAQRRVVAFVILGHIWSVAWLDLRQPANGLASFALSI